MATITYCDMDDCKNNDDQMKVYSMSEEFSKKYKFGMYEDICQECLDAYCADGYIDKDDIVIDFGNVCLKSEMS